MNAPTTPLPPDVQSAVERIAQGLLDLYAMTKDELNESRGPETPDEVIDGMLAGIDAQARVVYLCRASLILDARDRSLAVSVLKALAEPMRDRLNASRGGDANC